MIDVATVLTFRKTKKPQDIELEMTTRMVL